MIVSPKEFSEQVSIGDLIISTLKSSNQKSIILVTYSNKVVFRTKSAGGSYTHFRKDYRNWSDSWTYDLLKVKNENSKS